jgi:glycosyltransferase involved in cell wall biosynthesis
MELVSRHQVHVVIAAYNEGTVIARVVADVRRAGYPVVLVDDGSLDETADIAAAAGAEVVRHPFNLGQGAALQTGIDYALEQRADALVTFDADGQHSPAAIAALLEVIEQPGIDFALGSRFLTGATANLPVSRRILLSAALWFTRESTGLPVTDTHNGLRAMTARGARAIYLRQSRMAHASEILHQIAQSRLRFVEVPVNIEYSAYSLSKGQRITDALTILIDLFARRLYP